MHFLKHGQMVRAWAGPFQGTKLIIADNWVPYQPVTIVTPPFAEYLSGHSIFSAAGAEIFLSGSPAVTSLAIQSRLHRAAPW